jgi:hypothetical protein
VKHPKNTFIIVEDACCMLPKLYEGKNIRGLVSRGLDLAPSYSGYNDIKKFLDFGLEA